MSGLLNLPGSKGGYVSLDRPVKEHTVSAGGIKAAPIELGDLANDAFFNEVARIRDGIRTLDSSIDDLSAAHLASLQSTTSSSSPSHELASLSSSLSTSIASYRTRIEVLGPQVEGEAKRGHWDALKKALERAVEKWHRVERAHRERVRDKIARQMLIVNPDASEHEIKQAFETSGGAAGPPQIFQQALAGTRSAAATAALHEATSRRGELVHIEETLVELAQLMQQVADLVIVQDSTITHIESTPDAVRADLEHGTKQVGLARASAAAARHKRKMCAAFALVLVVVLVVVVAVEVRKAGGGGGGGASEPEGEKEKETQTVTAGAAETAAHVATAVAGAVTGAARWRR
ncbi:uncharacterized protein RHOBADRAFT_43231 [Rhodotorula graminis WP1]|uniref:t-SNARE coiled-coil homology domain-containing protein n=1 Tax=Rhodotorula graminis (strain WP1) TaxID=578459 RepID=A0A194S5E5_RHOGW|nr:uncharacterized protein RHOBADRAFT_43231 [Rhodotorula graminis WP1]KPV75807.1 hypothetical protein RHOBADRAFT_43231 [Rhodotorula graminis WP1]